MPYAYVLHGQLYYDNCGDDVSDEFVIGSFKKGGMLEEMIKISNKEGIYLDN